MKKELSAGTTDDKRTAAESIPSASLEQNGLLSAADFEKLHPDSEQLLKVCFEEIRQKMIKSQKKYGWSNEWLTQDWEDECRKQMIEHFKKGDPRDVAIYSIFMIYRGWSTNTAELNSVSSR